MKDFFLPTAQNGYQPKLLTKFALYLYLAIILVTNLGFTLLIPQTASAEVNVNLLYQYHNQEREKRGLGDLAVNTQLIESATAKAKAMLASNCWSHYCPDGKSPWDFFADAGYEYIYAGENLAEGFDDTNKVIQAWMNSPTHRANIINDKFTEIGIGYATGSYQNMEHNTIIVVHFGKRNDVAGPNILPATGSLDINKVQFTYPTEQTFINSPQPLIQGTAPSNAKINITLNGNLNATVQASDTSFTYIPSKPLADGQYTLYGEAYNLNNTFLGSSKTLTFTIDTVPPSADQSTLKVKSVVVSSDSTTIILTSDDNDVAQITEKNTGVKSFRSTGGDLSLEFNKANIAKYSTLNFSVQDKAGNATDIVIPTTSLLQMANIKEKEIPGNSAINDFINSFNGKDIKTTTNWGFVIFLTTIFGIDFAYLKQTGFTNLKRSKSHLHLATFVILILILVVGITNGNILTGTMK